MNLRAPSPAEDALAHDDAGRRQLRRLISLRWVALATMTGIIAIAHSALDFALPLLPLTVVVVSGALMNAWTRWRLTREWSVGAHEVLLHLLADTALLTAALYFSGGWSNPFVSMFLLPLVIAATSLAPRHAWIMAGATFLCYSLLGFWYVPLPHMHHGETGDFDLHVLGMWVSFVISAGVIAYFVVRMAASLRERDQELAEARERALRNQHVLALGTLAAGAAHQLGTPLATMAVVVQEIVRDRSDDVALTGELRQLRAQIDECKSIISDLVAVAGQSRGESARAESFDRFLRGTVESWRVLRPGVDVALSLDGTTPAPRIVAERTLGHTLITLLNNAADAAPDGIEMQGTWDDGTLAVEIRDRGKGIPPSVLSRAGKAATSTKSSGHSVGLLIANAALERYGGRVTLSNRVDGGACTRIELPLARITPA